MPDLSIDRIGWVHCLVRFTLICSPSLHRAYIHDHCLGYRHNYALFYKFPNSNFCIHFMICSRENPLVKTMAPGSILIIYKNPKIPCSNLFYFVFLFIYLSVWDLILAVSHEGIDNPLFALGASICYFVCRFC